MTQQTKPTIQRRTIIVKSKACLIVLLIGAVVAAFSTAAYPKETRRSLSVRPSAAAMLLPATALSELRARAAMEDKGQFKLVYTPIKDHELAHIEKMIKDSHLFERLVDDSNKQLALPVDISVIFKECNGRDEDPTNAFYTPDNHSITLCYGLIKKSEELFKDDEKT